MNEMMVMCEPTFPDDSSLECSEHLRFCRGRNIMINFTDLAMRNEPLRYKMDVLKDGEIGGYCRYYKDRLMEQADHISPLQSWGPEMRFFTQLNRRPIIENDCDIVIEKPTFIMKIDASNFVIKLLNNQVYIYLLLQQSICIIISVIFSTCTLHCIWTLPITRLFQLMCNFWYGNRMYIIQRFVIHGRRLRNIQY